MRSRCPASQARRTCCSVDFFQEAARDEADRLTGYRAAIQNYRQARWFCASRQVSANVLIEGAQFLPTRPLSGLKVLDLSRVLSGPYATRMLSDLGADVLKVEPPEGDMTRKLGKRTGTSSGYYLQNNIGKRNICVDLKADGARDLMFDLVRTADVVVENFRPGVMNRLGLSWQELSAINPRLVMLSISGFGQEGVERERAAYAPVLHAEAGLIARQSALAGGGAGDFAVNIADTYTSLHGVIGLLAALRLVEQTGVGQHVDIGMIDVIHSVDDVANMVLDGVWTKETHSGLWSVWEAPEGKQIGIAATLRALWRAFSELRGLVDPGAGIADKKTAEDLRRDSMAGHLLDYVSFDALTAELDAMRLAWGRVRGIGEDTYAEPSVASRGILVEVEDNLGNKRRVVQSPYKFSNAESGISSASRAADTGEHNESALRDWLGWESERIEGLRASGVLVTSSVVSSTSD